MSTLLDLISPPASPCGRPLATARIPRRARGRRTIYAQDLEAQLRATIERLTELDEMQLLEPADRVEILRLRRLERRLVEELDRVR